MAWDTNPLYAMLHEAIYCQGAASRWAAHRIRCALLCLPAAGRRRLGARRPVAGSPAAPALSGWLIACLGACCPPCREAEFSSEFDAVAQAQAGRPVMFTGGCACLCWQS